VLASLLLRMRYSARAALFAWAGFALSLPVIAYGSRIYPGPLMTLLAVLVGTGLFAPAPLSGVRALAAGLVLASFPWFGLKFVGPAAALGLALALRLRRHPRRLLLLALPALLSAALLLWFLRAHFGGFAPDAIYGRAMPGGAAQPPAWHWELRALIPALAAFFFDQRIGLLIYAPVFALAAPGLVLLWRRRPRLAAALGLTLLGVLIPHALKWIWGGSCPPGRPLLPVMWIFALLVAEYVEVRPRRGFTLLGTSLLLGAIAIVQPKLFYGATHFLADQRGRLWAACSAPGLDLTALLPRLIGLEPDWGKLALAAALLGAATWLLLRRRALFPAWVAPALLALLGAGLWSRGAGWGDPMAERLALEHGSVALLENAEPAGRALALRRGAVRLLITQDRPLEQLELRFVPLAGSARIKGSLESHAFSLDLGAGERGRLRLRPTGAALRGGGEFHYRLRLRVDGAAARTRLILRPHPSQAADRAELGAQGFPRAPDTIRGTSVVIPAQAGIQAGSPNSLYAARPWAAFGHACHPFRTTHGNQGRSPCLFTD